MSKFEFTLGDGIVKVIAYPLPRDLKSFFGDNLVEIETIEGWNGEDLSGSRWEEMALDYIDIEVKKESIRRLHRVFAPC
jgi:hypothetical protein